VYAGATLEVAMTVASKRLRVLALRCEAGRLACAAAAAAMVAIMSS
jgi:hypothetical protein